MASHAAPPVKSGRQTDAEWRAGLRRSLRRLAQMTGAGLLLGACLFLALALPFTIFVHLVWDTPWWHQTARTIMGV